MSIAKQSWISLALFIGWSLAVILIPENAFSAVPNAPAFAPLQISIELNKLNDTPRTDSGQESRPTAWPPPIAPLSC